MTEPFDPAEVAARLAAADPRVRLAIGEWPAEIAVAGVGELPGAVWRPGDPDKHLTALNRDGVPRPRWSPLLTTLCGLDATAGPWLPIGEMDDDVWCAACLEASAYEHRVEAR